MKKILGFAVLTGLLLWPTIRWAKTVHVTASPGIYQQGVIHTPVPPGNNSVGISWKAVLLDVGESGSTILTEDTFITSTEYNQIISGDVIEIPYSIILGDDRITSADVITKINQTKSNLQDKYDLYGKTYN